MRTYSEIQEKRALDMLREPIEFKGSIRIDLQPQELLQLIRFLYPELEPSSGLKLIKNKIGLDSFEIVVAYAKSRIPESSLEEALILLHRYGLTDRLRLDLLQRMKEGRL